MYLLCFMFLQIEYINIRCSYYYKITVFLIILLNYVVIISGWVQKIFIVCGTSAVHLLSRAVPLFFAFF